MMDKNLMLRINLESIKSPENTLEKYGVDTVLQAWYELLYWVAQGDREAIKVHRMMDRYLAKTAKKVAKKRASVKTP